MPAQATPAFARPLARHGEIRGLQSQRLEHVPLPGPKSAQFEGRFGKMFEHSDLKPAYFTDADLARLGRAMTAELEAEETPETKFDDEENPGIRAGYTYLGQFIDHDLTFDPVSNLDRLSDPYALVDFRTPRFDLDCLYGRGPGDQPYLYRSDGLHMLLGDRLTGATNDPNARGVPRNRPSPDEPARALLGDPRNDENVIISQLHAAMLRFHNRVVDFTRTSNVEEAQRIVRFHYQWVVLNDFLPTIIGQETWESILPNLAKRTSVKQDPPQIRFYNWKRGVMPVEFSVAAYRFGHSMVRPIYRLNTNLERLKIFRNDDDPGNSLVGFREFPSNWGIDWSLFFDLEPAPEPNLGPKRIQPAYKIDSSLVNPLGGLPRSVASNPSSLAERNLKRGVKLELPSGQDVARAMQLEPIDDEELKVGKATADGRHNNKTLASLVPNMKGRAPLWYYILAEAQQQFKTNKTPIRLGPVGGRIVGEVFAGLMLADKQSFLHSERPFQPIREFQSPNGRFGIAELLKQAIQA